MQVICGDAQELRLGNDVLEVALLSVRTLAPLKGKADAWRPLPPGRGCPCPLTILQPHPHRQELRAQCVGARIVAARAQLGPLRH
eukprot:scaffold324800_cov58-Tisochrysis_lutea.AAC.2